MGSRHAFEPAAGAGGGLQADPAQTAAGTPLATGQQPRQPSDKNSSAMTQAVSADASAEAGPCRSAAAALPCALPLTPSASAPPQRRCPAPPRLLPYLPPRSAICHRCVAPCAAADASSSIHKQPAPRCSRCCREARSRRRAVRCSGCDRGCSAGAPGGSRLQEPAPRHARTRAAAAGAAPHAGGGGSPSRRCHHSHHPAPPAAARAAGPACTAGCRAT